VFWKEFIFMELAVGLKPDGEGQKLWAWLTTSGEIEGIEGCQPLAIELCRLADRLEEVRSKIASQGLYVSGSRGRPAKNPLIDIEVKLSGQFAKVWRVLGLADKPVEQRLPVGRPPGAHSE
jgi:hypothetical protein